MSTYSHYLQGGRVVTVGASAPGMFEAYALPLDVPDALWERVPGLLPLTHDYVAALKALQAWATERGLMRADCPVCCWYLEKQRTWCGFFFQEVDTRCGYALPLRCEKCRRFGSIPG